MAALLPESEHGAGLCLAHVLLDEQSANDGAAKCRGALFGRIGLSTQQRIPLPEPGDLLVLAAAFVRAIGGFGPAALVEVLYLGLAAVLGAGLIVAGPPGGSGWSSRAGCV